MSLWLWQEIVPPFLAMTLDSMDMTHHTNVTMVHVPYKMEEEVYSIVMSLKVALKA